MLITILCLAPLVTFCGGNICVKYDFFSTGKTEIIELSVLAVTIHVEDMIQDTSSSFCILGVHQC